MLFYLTGSSKWNQWVRSVCKKRGWKLNQYYLELNGKKKKYSDEKKLLKDILGHYVPPECREKPGDTYAEKEIISLNDIKGDFHIHTTKSDGSEKPSAMSRYCKKLGYTFCGYADHVGHMPWSASSKTYEKWIDTFRKNSNKLPIPTLIGAEMDVSKYGKLSIPFSVARKMDFIIISSHQNPGENLVERYTIAIKKLRKFKGIKILAHPINRNIEKNVMMEWGNINWTTIFGLAKKNNVYLEINGTPERMDLDWELARVAKRMGCKFTLSSDAHSKEGLLGMSTAVLFARKAGLTKEDILNCFMEVKSV